MNFKVREWSCWIFRDIFMIYFRILKVKQEGLLRKQCCALLGYDMWHVKGEADC